MEHRVGACRSIEVSKGARGFTLIELVVTLFVLAIAAGLVGPAIGRSLETVRARAEVSRFSAMLRHAREQAITTRQAHAFVVDPAGHRLVIVASGEVRETRTLPEHVRIEAASTSALSVRFEPHGVSTGGAFRVRSGPVAYRVTVDAFTGRVRIRRE